MCAAILIVDDSEDIREGVGILLESEGYQVLTADSGETALGLLQDRQTIDLIILDIMMPGQSGFETCREIREITIAPILFLSAKAGIEDKETGLIIGGDDYLPKPFSPVELVARIKALLRRYAVYQGKDHNVSSDVIKIRELHIYPSAEEVILAGKRIPLRHMEYRLLVHLALHRGRIFSAEELYETLWMQPFLPLSNHTVVTHIKNLRQKIEHDPKDPKYILTVWGKGYRIV
ncbi:response regulator transcription factor [Desulfitobacterium chlororespirans]|uniref:Stage 0 sporulation protein A homolog n=1 Tax=Desulfitobacterium chlororespirans DSM 11544 TaxID=1121395 RepID=A0A1M7SKJ2_9FIRM|nr:response regulator transcription factor [Desulfitobacterium chlororespirans]SHN58981.1 DNA-binding response regulator, OmpR family, contains REC and winged-helix (wHTH) domain [Desulfitobacterium chlororespirans DSM 11544]